MAIVPDPRGGRKLAVLGHEYTQVEVVNVTNGSATAIIAEWESCWCACINSISVVTEVPDAAPLSHRLAKWLSRPLRRTSFHGAGERH